MTAFTLTSAHPRECRDPDRMVQLPPDQGTANFAMSAHFDLDPGIRRDERKREHV